MNISQRQATIAILGFQLTILFILWLSQVIQGPGDSSLTVGAGIASLAYGGMLLAYLRGWEYARHTSVVLITILVGEFLPEPFITSYAPFLILLGPILALVLLDPVWVIGSAVATIGLLLLRAGGVGVYANMTTLLNYAMLIAGLVVSRLITETARAQIKTKESQIEHQATLLRYINDAVIAVDDQYHITAWNEAAEKMYGWKAEEVMGKSSTDIIRSGMTTDERNEVLEQLRTLGSYRNEMVQFRRDGSAVTIEANTIALTDNSNNFSGLLSVNRDVSERKRAEQAERQTEEQYHGLFNTMFEGFCIIEVLFDAADRPVDYRFLEINPAFEAQTGLRNAQGKRMRELAPEHEQHWFEIYGKVALTGESTRFVNEARALNRWYEVSAYRIGGPGSHNVAVLFNDITKVKQADAAHIQLAAIIESSDDAIIGKTLDGVITSWNNGAVQLYGYTAAEAIGQSLSLLIPADLPDELQDILAQVKRGESLKHIETVRINKDGTRLNVSMTISPIRDDAGRLTGASTIARDITQRKRAEKALQTVHDALELQFEQRTAALSQANALLETMLNYLPDQIYFKDHESRFIRNSRSQAMALGLSDPAEVIGKTDFDFFPHAQRSFADEREIMETGKPLLDLEERVVWPDKKETWVSTTKMPLRNKDGRIIGTFGISRDITDRKKAEEALWHKSNQLESANKELESFAYSVSHDLRSPLRSIDGFSNAILEDYGAQLPLEAQDYLKRVRAAAQRMAELIDDLLNLSRVTRAPLNAVPVDLVKLAKNIVAELQQNHSERKVSFNIAPNLKAQGDPRLLQIVLENLLNNAWKFTSKQEHAEIEFGSKTENNETIYFVKDNGAGFDMAYADKLFGAFQRLHAMTEFPGTGIGLATVQRVIHRHGGRIWAEAELDKGATFFFSLPTSESEKPPAMTKEPVSISERAREII